MVNKQRIATLTLDDGRSIELPILSGTLGPDVVDMRGHRASWVYSHMTRRSLPRPVAPPTITFIDGDAGLLYYRGYPIEQLAEKSDFLEVCYCCSIGELPNAQQKAAFMPEGHAATPWCTTSCAFFQRVPPRCASDGGDGGRGGGAVGVLS